MQKHIQFNTTENAHITKHIIILIALAYTHALVVLQAHHGEHVLYYILLGPSFFTRMIQNRI
jgi:hypothetical protein